MSINFHAPKKHKRKIRFLLFALLAHVESEEEKFRFLFATKTKQETFNPAKCLNACLI